MKYRIKKEHLNKQIRKGGDSIYLSDELEQKQILFIKNMISAEFVEEVKEEKKPEQTELEKVTEQVEKYSAKSKAKKRKNDAEDSNKSE